MSKKRNPKEASIKIVMCLAILMPVIHLSSQIAEPASDGDLTSLRNLKIQQVTGSLLPPADSTWYIGKQYNMVYINAVGTPYYFDDNGVEGDICFNGAEYQNQEFLYDLVRDELVIKTFIPAKGIEYIVLNSGWVEWIRLRPAGSEFLFVTEKHPAIVSYNLPDGYYEIVHHGPAILLLARHRKVMEFRADQSDHNVYAYIRDLYLVLEDHLHEVTKERKLLQMFPDHKREIRSARKRLGGKFETLSTPNLKELMQQCEEILNVQESVGEYE